MGNILSKTILQTFKKKTLYTIIFMKSHSVETERALGYLVSNTFFSHIQVKHYAQTYCTSKLAAAKIPDEN